MSNSNLYICTFNSIIWIASLIKRNINAKTHVLILKVLDSI